MAKKKAAAAPGAKKTSTPSTKKKVAKVVKGRGKRGGVNKSQAIRDYMDANPTAGPKEVVEALAKKGVKVTPPQVSNVKTAAKKKAGVKPMRRKKAGRPAGNTSAAGKVSVAALLETNAFIDKVGGVGAAKELIATLEKINK